MSATGAARASLLPGSTVVQDLLSLVIHFGTANAVMG